MQEQVSLEKRISRKERKDAKILKEYEASKKSLRLYPENKSYSKTLCALKKTLRLCALCEIY
jgi:hypothetical protein